MQAIRRADLFALLGLLSACSSVDVEADSAPGSTGAASVDPSGPTDPSGGSQPTGDGTLTDATTGPLEDPTTTGNTDTGNTDTGDTGDDTGGSGELGGPFLRGINFGFRNPNWGDADMAWLAAEAGSTSARLSLPETHLEKWGYDIEVGDMQTYQADGLQHHIAFLIAPIAAHSTAPNGTPDWELANYIPSKIDMV